MVIGDSVHEAVKLDKAVGRLGFVSLAVFFPRSQAAGHTPIFLVSTSPWYNLQAAVLYCILVFA